VRFREQGSEEVKANIAEAVEMHIEHCAGTENRFSLSGQAASVKSLLDSRLIL
jgi:hypothetical protein